MMKRAREIDGTLDMSNCLMLLSKIGEPESKKDSPAERVFVCKTCNREFPSFQALGGHRASHKKPKLSADEILHNSQRPGSPVKPKTHECSICGLEFAIGQALGGHMRRHRQVLSGVHEQEKAPVAAPTVLKKSTSGKRVCFDYDLDLDLHLAPPGICDLKLQLMAPTY
ncbi:hypothetical protein UlMin_013509 [Ulmus minor]